MAIRRPLHQVLWADEISPFLHLPDLERLREAILGRRERVVAISGQNATGKTVLWQEMLRRHRKELASRIEVINCRYSPRTTPQLEEGASLVVLDDLHNENTEEWYAPIQLLLHQNPLKQFLLVSCFPEFIEKFLPSTHIRLGGFESLSARRALLGLVSAAASSTEMQRAIEYCQGDIRLLRALLAELTKNRGDIQTALQSLSTGINYSLSSGGLLVPTKRREWLEFTANIQTINGELLRSVQRNPDVIFNLTPRQFEQVTAELMEKRGYKVELTKATRDGGKDLILASHSDLGQFVFYVECKRYAPDDPVGVHLVRQLAGAVHADRVTAGIMVTSSYFSPDAISFSHQLQHQLSLVNFMKLKAWLKDAG